MVGLEKTFLILPLPAFLSLVQSCFRYVLPAAPLSANAVSLRTAASDLPSSSPPLAKRIPSCSSLPQQPGAVPCAAKLWLCAPAVSPALAMFSDAITACFQNEISQISQKEQQKKKCVKTQSRYPGNLYSVNVPGLFVKLWGLNLCPKWRWHSPDGLVPGVS